MGTMTVPASMEYLDKVMAEVEEALMKAGCGEDEKRLIEISVEELFTNIASYAYAGVASLGDSGSGGACEGGGFLLSG